MKMYQKQKPELLKGENERAEEREGEEREKEERVFKSQGDRRVEGGERVSRVSV